MKALKALKFNFIFITIQLLEIYAKGRVEIEKNGTLLF